MMSSTREKIAKVTELCKVTPDMSVDAVNDAVANAVSYITINAGGPEAVVKFQLRLSDDETKVTAIEFSVKISKKERVEDIKKKKFNVLVTEHTIETMADDFAVWFDDVTEYVELSHDVNELNAIVAEIVEEKAIDFSVKFVVSDNKIEEISDTFIEVGITREVAKKIKKLPVFDAPDESIKENYKVIIADTLKACARPFDIFQSKSVFARDLDLYTRVTIAKLIRKTCSKQAKNIRDGYGYVDTDGIFALVDRYFVSKAEAKELEEQRGEPVHIEEKTCDNKRLKDKEMVVSYYRLSPFNKETLESEELVLQF